MNFEYIFTLLLIRDLYKRICLLKHTKFSWVKMVVKSGVLCCTSASKDISLALYEYFKDTFFVGADAWRNSIISLNYLFGSAIVAGLTIFWGTQILLKLKESHSFRKTANVQIKDKNMEALIQLVLWMMFTNVLRVSFSIVQIIKSNSWTKFASCMHGEDDAEGGEKCTKLWLWIFFTDTPLPAIIFSFSDLIYVAIIKLFC